MRIILDTNVLASGLFFPGIPLKILKSINQGKYRIIASQEIVDEYKRTIDKLANRFPNVINANTQLELIILSSDICQPQKLIEPVCADPDDDKFISCAIASKTKIVISGDKHLLDVSGYKDIEVLTPRQFVDKYIS
ncbi:MAG: putative toxin-antitoxin system toxin component, PIN family [Candidatus Omnitrophica bacterium]|nr:putative toxin-antitoxin system toxin component, PIN family [Candidatus Omnitrophota bacterium]MBI5024481.1 putative toxin-antitoxin system toxin component, PIN family [Candidatus Omnitrophota bacterium]